MSIHYDKLAFTKAQVKLDAEELNGVMGEDDVFYIINFPFGNSRTILDAKTQGASKLEIQKLQQQSGKPKSLDKITEVTNRLQQLLLKKNKAYGNSALEPLGVFSKQGSIDSLCTRIDDKLSRIKNKGINSDTEDTLFDLAGYLVLLIIARDDEKEKV
jgi:hypothetical protein